MIYTVTFNPSLDYIVDVDNFRAGELNRISREIIFPGGKGINVSIVLKNLGAPSVALGFTAGFTGDEIKKRLDSMGITTDFIDVTGGNSRVNFKIKSDVETEINGQGPVISEENINELYSKLDALRDGDYLILAGSIPSTLPSTIYMDIMKRLKERRIRIVVDASGELLRNVLALKPFLIKPNIDELGELFDDEIEDIDDVVTYARRLQEQGARNVLVSMGGDGAILVTEDSRAHLMRAPKGEVVNSVGAGDSMVAGFIEGLRSGDYEIALKKAVYTGSASAFGDGLATKESVEFVELLMASV